MNQTSKENLRSSLHFHLQSLVDSGVSDYLLPFSPSAPTTAAPQSVESLAPLNPLIDLESKAKTCMQCDLSKSRKQVVFGVGNPKAQLMFVGEAPGFDEDEQGLPFVGASGQLLTKMILAMGFTRNDVYIANVVKCRPPGNRDPEENEVKACSDYLREQIKIIQPKIIVTLGKFASQFLGESQIPISKLRGEFRMYKNIWVMPTYHPAFLIRNPEMKRPVWEDLQKVVAKLKELNSIH